MKLSEAIILGSLEVEPMPGAAFWPSTDGHVMGCAIGMGLYAVGYRPIFFNLQTTNHEAAAFVRWPWLFQKSEVPCNCAQKFNNAGQVIQHLFDWHHKDGWSLEKIASWVASIEPSTPETVAGRDPIESHQELCVVKNEGFVHAD